MMSTQVDIGMVRDAAIASKRANVGHFSLLTSKGANAKVWANDWKVSHTLLYMRRKGVAENEVINVGFPRTSVFRPGMLNRGNRSRGYESLILNLMPATPVADVARAMIYDAESTPIDSDAATEKPVFYEEADVKFLAKR